MSFCCVESLNKVFMEDRCNKDTTVTEATQSLSWMSCWCSAFILLMFFWTVASHCHCNVCDIKWTKLKLQSPSVQRACSFRSCLQTWARDLSGWRRFHQRSKDLLIWFVFSSPVEPLQFSEVGNKRHRNTHKAHAWRNGNTSQINHVKRGSSLESNAFIGHHTTGNNTSDYHINIWKKGGGGKLQSVFHCIIGTCPILMYGEPF